ncbi:MAG TPA: hypothetical protein VK670_02610 [Silvibacterium sp.]|nr:hypothetical protein [Silvibacterium sp.]
MNSDAFSFPYESNQSRDESTEAVFIFRRSAIRDWVGDKFKPHATGYFTLVLKAKIDGFLWLKH